MLGEGVWGQCLNTRPVVCESGPCGGRAAAKPSETPVGPWGDFRSLGRR